MVHCKHFVNTDYRQLAAATVLVYSIDLIAIETFRVILRDRRPGSALKDSSCTLLYAFWEKTSRRIDLLLRGFQGYCRVCSDLLYHHAMNIYDIMITFEVLCARA